MLADHVDVDISYPPIASVQQRVNAVSAKSFDCQQSKCQHVVEKYYLLNVAIPFVDHIIQELRARLQPISKTASSLLALIPSVFVSNDTSASVDALCEAYYDDMPSPALAKDEINRWHDKFTSDKVIPDNCQAALEACDPVIFPNVHVLLQIACTLPITSCECECSASVVRRLHNYLRTNMSEERLSSLALLHIHYSFLIDLEKVVDQFAKLHPRKMILELD